MATFAKLQTLESIRYEYDEHGFLNLVVGVTLQEDDHSKIEQLVGYQCDKVHDCSPADVMFDGNCRELYTIFLSFLKEEDRLQGQAFLTAGHRSVI